MKSLRFFQSYYGLQLIFAFSILTLWLSLCLMSWLTSIKRHEQSSMAEFERILNHKINFLGIIGDRQSTFINDERTIRLAEIVSYPFLSKMRSIIATSENAGSVEFPDMPMAGATGLFVSRKGRLIYQAGQNFEDYFGKDWARLLFLSMRSGGDLFIQRAKSLYSFPISYEEFLATANRFQMIFRKGNFLLRWYFSIGDWNVIYIIHLDPLKPESLKQEAVKMFLQGYNHLTLGLEDAFVFGSTKKSYSNTSPGIVWTEQPETFLEHLLKRPVFILFLLLPGIWLYRKGGYLILSTRFEFRYLLYAALPIIISMALIWVWLEPHHLNHKAFLRSQNILKLENVLNENIRAYIEHLSNLPLNNNHPVLPAYRLTLQNNMATYENVTDPVLKVLLLSILGSNRYDKTPIAGTARSIARNLSRGSHNYRKMVDQALNNKMNQEVIHIKWQEDILLCNSKILGPGFETAEAFCYSQKEIANHWFLSQMPSVLKQMQNLHLDPKSLIMIFNSFGTPMREFSENTIPDYDIENLSQLHEVRESLWLDWDHYGNWLSTYWNFEFPSDRKFLILTSAENITKQYNKYLRLPLFLMFLSLALVFWNLLNFKSRLLMVLGDLKSMVLKLRFENAAEHQTAIGQKNHLIEKLLILKENIQQKLRSLPYLSPGWKSYLSNEEQCLKQKEEKSCFLQLQFSSADINFDPRPIIKKICDRYPLLYSEGISLRFCLAIPYSLSIRAHEDCLLAALDIAHLLPPHTKLLGQISSQQITYVCLGNDTFCAPVLKAQSQTTLSLVEDLKNYQQPDYQKYLILMDSKTQSKVQYLHAITKVSESLYTAIQ